MKSESWRQGYLKRYLFRRLNKNESTCCTKAAAPEMASRREGRAEISASCTRELAPTYRSLDQDISLARRRAKLMDYSSPIFIGNIEWYRPEDLLTIDAKVMVREKNLYLIECPLFVHDHAASILLRDFEFYLSQEIVYDELLLFHGNQGAFQGYVNKFMSGTEGVGKIPDGVIALDITRARISRPIVCETGFRNEGLRELLIEGSNWVNEFTDTDICILLEINENEEKTDVESFGLYVFKRCTPFWSTAYPKPEVACLENWSCTTVSEEIRGFTSPELAETLFQAQVLAHFPYISRETLGLGQRIVVGVPTDGLNAHYSPLSPFDRPRVSVDLASTFNRLFTTINMLVQKGTYPSLD